MNHLYTRHVHIVVIGYQNSYPSIKPGSGGFALVQPTRLGWIFSGPPWGGCSNIFQMLDLSLGFASYISYI